jgi:hypothetical protein
MGLGQLDSSLSAKVGGTSKFTSRRGYQEAMAPQGTSAQTSDSESEGQTRPPVLRLRGAGNRTSASLTEDRRFIGPTSLKGIQIHQLMSLTHMMKRRRSARGLKVI